MSTVLRQITVTRDGPSTRPACYVVTLTVAVTSESALEAATWALSMLEEADS